MWSIQILLILQVIQKSSRSYRFCRLYISCRSYRPTDKNVRIMQIVHTPSRRTDHTDSTQVDHTDPADYIDSADHAHSPINYMCRSCRSYKRYFAKGVQIRQIGQIPSRSKCTDCTDHADSTQAHIYENRNQTDPIPAKHVHVTGINQTSPGTQVRIIRNIYISPGKLFGVCR